MRFALAGWLAAAAGAAARPLPVYREYTVPITFALDPETPSAAADLAAPDLAARARDLVGLRVQHRVQQLFDLLRHQPVQLRLEHVLVDL